MALHWETKIGWRKGREVVPECPGRERVQSGPIRSTTRFAAWRADFWSERPSYSRSIPGGSATSRTHRCVTASRVCVPADPGSGLLDWVSPGQTAGWDYFADALEAMAISPSSPCSSSLGARPNRRRPAPFGRAREDRRRLGAGALSASSMANHLLMPQRGRFDPDAEDATALRIRAPDGQSGKRCSSSERRRPERSFSVSPSCRSMS